MIGTEEMYALPQLPKTLAVVGAGASGAEIASAYARLGSEVLLFEALDRVLPTKDVEISRLAERGLKMQGMKVFTRTLVKDVEAGDDAVRFTYNGEAGEVEWLVIAAGGGPDEEGLGLADAGVKLTDRGLIEVDGALRTSVKGVWAIGDIVPGPALAHKASGEGIIAAEDIAGLETHPFEYSTSRARPSAARTSPRSASPRRRRRSRATTSSSAECPTAPSAPARSTATAPA